MRIGFDAKRAFHNRSGLGNYSRDVIRALTHDYPANDYVLYTPTEKPRVDFSPGADAQIRFPEGNPGKIKQARWRSYELTGEIEKDQIDIYHGLSHELPKNIEDSKVKSLVTIHDLIFLRYPQWYPFFDRKIYKAKFRHACRVADRIVAISQQTRADIMYFFDIPASHIDVVYQSCNDAFKREATEEEKLQSRKKFNLPENYLLYVGTIEERKNLLNIIRAIDIGNIDMPLVVVGRKTGYFKKVEKYIRKHNVKGIHFLSEVQVYDLPALYQMADIFVYPSVFEGFGIPVLEALYSRTPVITSIGSCFHEVGGKNSIYIDPDNPDDIASAITRILHDRELRTSMCENGYTHALQFSQANLSNGLMNIYTQLYNA